MERIGGYEHHWKVLCGSRQKMTDTNVLGGTFVCSHGLPECLHAAVLPGSGR